MKKIVLFKGGVETLGFFSEEIAKTLVSMGYEVFMFDYTLEANSAYELLDFYEKNNTVMLSFNFHGLCNEELLRDDDDVYIWDELNIPCYNIVVDHPFYYDRFMPQLPAKYCQISIDKNHMDYMKRFYPHVKLGPFIPLGGTDLSWEGELLPIKDRPIDILFTGSWAEPEFFGEYMKQEGPEYEEFYTRVLKEQIDNPDKTFEEIFEPMLINEAEDVALLDDDTLRDLYSRLVHFDMYVRYYFRGEVVRILADAGYKIKCIGGGWNKLPCKYPENIIHEEYSPSIECLRAIRQAKISINVMPWFKRGAHDRIFNTMLNGAVCLTDSSEYLDEFLVSGENCILFDLKELDMIPDIVGKYLSDMEGLQEIADRGRQLAKGHHTWDERARSIMKYIEEDLKG